MSKKTFNLMVLCLVVLLTFILGGCFNSPKKVSAEKSFEQTIDEKLYNISHPKDSTFHSHPIHMLILKMQMVKRTINILLVKGKNL